MLQNVFPWIFYVSLCIWNCCTSHRFETVCTIRWYLHVPVAAAASHITFFPPTLVFIWSLFPIEFSKYGTLYLRKVLPQKTFLRNNGAKIHVSFFLLISFLLSSSILAVVESYEQPIWRDHTTIMTDIHTYVQSFPAGLLLLLACPSLRLTILQSLLATQRNVLCFPNDWIISRENRQTVWDGVMHRVRCVWFLSQDQYCECDLHDM